MNTFCHSPRHARQQGMSRGEGASWEDLTPLGREPGGMGAGWDGVTSLEKGEETGGNNQEPLIPTLTKGLPGAGHCARHGRGCGWGGVGEPPEGRGTQAELEGAAESEKEQDRVRKKATETERVAGEEQEERDSSKARVGRGAGAAWEGGHSLTRTK